MSWVPFFPPAVRRGRPAIHTGLAATGFVLSTTAYVVAESVFSSTSHHIHGNLGIAVMVRRIGTSGRSQVQSPLPPAFPMRNARPHFLRANMR